MSLDIPPGDWVPEFIVILESLTKRFGDVISVDNISLEVRRGEFITLLGPSGSGKTTIMMMIAGFQLKLKN